jgi:hypothetical protein
MYTLLFLGSVSTVHMFAIRCCRNRVVSVLSCQRSYATVLSSIIGQRPHSFDLTKDEPSTSLLPLLDRHILQAALCGYKTPLLDIIKQYIDTSGAVLDVSLPYESRPSETRRPQTTTGADSCRNVVTVAHCARVGPDHKITLSSGFALNVESRKRGETLIITCAHTLEEVRSLFHEITISFSLMDLSTYRCANRLCCYQTLLVLVLCSRVERSYWLDQGIP